MRNPNKVRALLVTFATANPLNFNSADGRGFEFISAKVRELDAINPQVAARLLGAFRSWRTLETGRRDEARRVLGELARAKPLSRDVYEIVERIIA